MYKKKCNCENCKWSRKTRKFLSTLTEKQKQTGEKLINELWIRYESDSTELGVLHAKIDGSWPKEENESYYERIRKSLYKIESTKIE